MTILTFAPTKKGSYVKLNLYLQGPKYAIGIQDKRKEVASLEKHVLLKKLRDALESLRGRVTGKNKGDVEEAISMVSMIRVDHCVCSLPLSLIF